PLPEDQSVLCAALLKAFEQSLQAGDGTTFSDMLMDTLQLLELADADLNPWQEMLSRLRRALPHLPGAWQAAEGPPPTVFRLANDMLHQARAALGESAQRRDQRHQSQREIAAFALSELTAQLGATLDETRVAEVLEKRLADVGIRHARVALFEPD